MMKNRSILFQIFVGRMLSKIPFFETRRCLRRIKRYQIPLTYDELSVHHLAGGRIAALVDGLVYAKEHGINLDIKNASAFELLAPATQHSLIEQIQILEAKGYGDRLGIPVKSWQTDSPNQKPKPTPAAIVSSLTSRMCRETMRISTEDKTTVLAAIRGTFGESSSGKIAKRLFSCFLLIGFPAFFFIIIFLHSPPYFQSGSADWFLAIIGLMNVPTGVLIWRSAGQTYVFDGIRIRQRNSSGRVWKEIEIAKITLVYFSQTRTVKSIQLKTAQTKMGVLLYPSLEDALNKLATGAGTTQPGSPQQ